MSMSRDVRGSHTEVTRPQIHRFEPQAMAVGESHGGSGVLLAARVRGVIPGSSIRHIDLVVLEPGASIGPHRHAVDNEEIYVVVSGRGDMLVEDTWVPVGSGDVIPNPPLGRHGFVNSRDREAWLVVIELVHAALPARNKAAE